GYTDGYYGRARNAALPPNAEQERANLARAAAADQSPPRAGSIDQPQTPADTGGRHRRTDYPATANYNIPGDTELRLKLNSAIDTRPSRRGNQSTALVISPPDNDGPTKEAHMANVQRSGRVSGKTERALPSNTIGSRDGTRRPIDAQLQR